MYIPKLQSTKGNFKLFEYKLRNKYIILPYATTQRILLIPQTVKIHVLTTAFSGVISLTNIKKLKYQLRD